MVDRNRFVALVVWASWAVLSLQGLVYVWKYGSNVPYWDDWLLVPALVDEEGPSWRWFWEQDNEHRMPLARFLLLAWIALPALDFRGPMFVMVLMLSALALGLLRMASRLRGRPALTDVVIPLLLLHVGHCENLLWSWQLAHVLILCLVGTALLLILRTRRRLSVSSALLVGVLSAALPLCGAPGMAYVFPLTIWIASASWQTWQGATPQARRAARVMLVAATWGPIATALYFVAYTEVGTRPPFELELFGKTVLQFLALGFGPGLASFGAVVGLLVASMVSGGVVLAVRLLSHRVDGEFLRPLGLLLLLGGFGLLCVGTALRRPGFANQPYYALYVLPALLTSYALYIMGGRGFGRSLAAWTLVATACVALWFNTWQGVDFGRMRRARMEAFEEDLRKELPVFVLLARHTQTIWPLTEGPENIAAHLLQLRDAGVGDFARIKDNPRFRLVPLDPAPRHIHNGAWEANRATGTGTGSYLTWTLDKPRYVAGIQLEYVTETSATPTLRVAWKPGAAEYPQAIPFIRRFYGSSWTAAEGTPVVVWVAETISELRIYPDVAPFQVRIPQVWLLVPE